MRGLSDEYGSWKIICSAPPLGGACAWPAARWPSTSTSPAGRLVEADDAAPERRLAAARLADEAERLAARDRQVDAVDGAQHVDRRACAARRDERGVEREVHGEAAHLEQRRAGASDTRASSSW